jgi:small subunit ribosomal protein S2
MHEQNATATQDAALSESNGSAVERDAGATMEEHVGSEVDAELETMFRAGVHFGYSRSRRHPKMAPFLFGIRNNVEIFDLVKVRSQLAAACEFVEALGRSGQTLLFVGTKPSLRHLVETAAREIAAPYVYERWLGGTLTNFKIIKGRVDRLAELKRQKASGELERYIKKERLMLQRDLDRLERHFGGLASLQHLPAALVIVDSGEERTAVREAARMRIPVVGILNVDCDPSQVTYPIPANDAAPSSVSYILERLVAAYKAGRASGAAVSSETATSA